MNGLFVQNQEKGSCIPQKIYAGADKNIERLKETSGGRNTEL